MGWKSLLFGLVCLQAVPVWAAMNMLNTVTVSQGAGDSQVVKLSFKDPLAELPVSFTTSNPHRLVLDFANTANAMGRGESLNSGVIKNFQSIQSGERTRVVLNLSEAVSQEIRKEKNVLLVVLKAGSAQAKAETPVQFPAATSKQNMGVRDIDFHRGPNGEGRITVSLSEPGVGVDIQQKGRAIQVDFLNTSLPSPLQRRMDVTDFATPAQTIETFEQGNITRMLVNPKGRWDYSAWQTGNQFVLEVRSLDDPQQQVKGDKPVYSGEKLSLTFQNVEVRAVLQVIADFTGLNIIASDTVTGNVTLRLKDVPWDQALDIILRAKGLDKRATGNVIWVAPRDELAAKEKMELEAKKAVEDLETLITKTYALNYVRADEAMQVLSGMSRSATSGTAEAATCSPSASSIQAEDTAAGANVANYNSTTTSASGRQTSTSSNVNRVLSHRGGAAFDLKSNTLVVTDTSERQLAVEKVLKTIDIPVKQVMIEARIVIADDTFGRDLGAKLGINAKIGAGATNIGVAGNATSSTTTATSTSAPATNSFNVNLPNSVAGATGGGIGFTIFNSSSNALLAMELQALETDNRGKIVSNPRVVTTNLRPAAILQGTQIPYQTTSTNGTQTSFKDALLCLLVSPQVLNNDSIILNVEVQKDAQGASTTAGPAINVKRVKTQVRVNNGETAVLGGIFEQTVRDDTSKVPVLGDIPVVGNLFKSNNRSDAKSEMLIFLTPKVLDESLSAMR
jgi:type IV pilus assembly protein PilQ